MIWTRADFINAILERKLVIEGGNKNTIHDVNIDLRLGRKIKVVRPGQDIDVVNSEFELEWQEVDLPPCTAENIGQGYELRRGTLVWGRTLERVSIPTNTLARVEGCSTSGRIGIEPHVSASKIYPGHGYDADGKPAPRPITLEIRTSYEGITRLYAGMAIVSMCLEDTTHAVEVGYDAAPGKTYGDDNGIMVPNLQRLVSDPNDAVEDLRSLYTS
jgi:deoxycytidine triphosphate deaminase